MRVDSCIILAAGMGSRMGKIGRDLPKPLWPLGRKKTFLSIQYEQIRKLGINHIYINTHHREDLVSEYVKKEKMDIEILPEAKLLNVGGTIQSLANKVKSGTCLLINCDQIFTGFEQILKGLKSSIKRDDLASLASIKLHHDEKYNRLRIQGEELKGILKYGEHKKFDNKTYSGLGIVNFSLVDEKSPFENPNFFDFLFSQGKKTIKTVEIDRDSYIDVGTKEKYIDFLFKRKGIDSLNLNTNYQDGFYNFSDSVWSNAPDGTVVIQGEQRPLSQRCLVFRDIIDLY